jgi:hypothetical protein
MALARVEGAGAVGPGVARARIESLIRFYLHTAAGRRAVLAWLG